MTARFPRPSIVEWFCLAGGLFLTIEYAWLMDDAFVYFRYVDNFHFLDMGLVYNQGEYVEGYSSPLWTLTLLVTRGIGLGYWLTVKLVGLLAFAAFWYGAIVLHRRLTPQTAPVINVPLAFLTFNYGMLCYFTSGLEAPFVHLAAVGCALAVVAWPSRWLQVLLGFIPLARPELTAAWLLLVLAVRWRHGRWPWLLAGSGAATLGGWLTFRVIYYADLFPNTYYLKDAASWKQGLLYLENTIMPYGLPWLVLTSIVLAWWSRRRDVPVAGLDARLWMLVLAAPIAFYVVRIGGDARHFRYLAFPFVLAALSTTGLVDVFLDTIAPRRWKRIAAVALGLGIAGGSFALYPPQLSEHPFRSVEPPEQVHLINDAAGHRVHETMMFDVWKWSDDFEQRDAYRAWMSADPELRYRNALSSGWCISIYAQFDVMAINKWGLTDPFLARMQVPFRRAAHKARLHEPARDLAALRYQLLNVSEKGAMETARARGLAPAWVNSNFEAIEVIEAKSYNRHRLGENLRLAFQFPRLTLPEAGAHSEE